MRDRISLSELASYYLTNVKQRLSLRGQDDYVPARIALGRSLQTKAEAVVSASVEIPEKDRRRKSIPLTTLEQGNRLYFQALLSQGYLRKVEDDEYVDLLTQHIEHGLWLIFTETEKVKGYDYLSVLISNSAIRYKLDDVVPSRNSDNQPPVDTYQTDVVRVRIGTEKVSQQPVFYDLNKANNPHMAIMGGSGSGKTYFLKHLLREIRKNSNYETHFIIFDYKDGDIAKDRKFVEDTIAEVIPVRTKPLPLNPFANAGTDERERIQTAERIVEIVREVEANIGKVQENNLYQAILNSYQITTPYPDFRTVRDELQQLNDRPDSLTSVLRPLIDQHYFANNDEHIYQHWLNKTLIVDIHDIERKDLVCFFVLRQIFQELKKEGPSIFNETSGARQLRTVVVIDEAHNFLSSKKRSKVLASMIREVRSSGGMVVLASQSPDDYDKADFNFLELVQFPMVLGCTPSSYKFLEQKFSLNSKQAKDMLNDIGRLPRGEAFILEQGQPTLVKLVE
ncbi:ATP-binding protein [Spirosoma arcticum]